MGMTMTQKILAAHAGLDRVTAGQLISAKRDGFGHPKCCESCLGIALFWNQVTGASSESIPTIAK